MKILTNLDLNKNQLMNTVLQQLSVAPANPSKGQIYFSTLTNSIKVWDGTLWTDLGGSPELVIGNITGLQDALNLKANEADVSAQLLTKETISGAQIKANEAEANAKAYTDAKVKTDVPVDAKFTDTIATKESVGLGSVDDTSDLAKPISNATQAALDLKEDKNIVTTKIETAVSNAKTYTDVEISKLVGEGTSQALDTLKELAEALGNDPNFATTIMQELSEKLSQTVSILGDGVSTVFEILHPMRIDVELGYMPTVQITERLAPHAVVYTDIEIAPSIITIRFAAPPASNQYVVAISGVKLEPVNEN